MKKRYYLISALSLVSLIGWKNLWAVDSIGYQEKVKGAVSTYLPSLTNPVQQQIVGRQIIAALNDHCTKTMGSAALNHSSVLSRVEPNPLGDSKKALQSKVANIIKVAVPEDVMVDHKTIAKNILAASGDCGDYIKALSKLKKQNK